MGCRDILPPLGAGLLSERREPELGGPYSSAFVELKDVAGLKVNFGVFNLNDGRVIYDRDVYSGRRNGAGIAFFERQKQKVGPIFTLTVSGGF